MKTEREIEIGLAVLEALKECGDYLLPHQHLYRQVRLKVTPSPDLGELDDVLFWLEGERRITSQRNRDTGLKWTITDAGRVWLRQNR